MDHRERYIALLDPEMRERLLEAVREQGYFEALKITRAAIVDAEPLPYLRLEIEPDPTFVACSGGMLLDLQDLMDDPPSGRFYLPYVGLTPKAQTTDEHHELTHLHDLLGLLQRRPGFAADAERLGLLNISDPELLEESVHFEVCKLFTLEVSAFGQEFDEGTQDIDMPIMPGMTLKYRCESREEFIRIWLANYLKGLKDKYEERFPEHGQQLEAAFRAATDEHGRDIFGEQPWDCATKERQDQPSRALARAMRSQSTRRR